MEIVLLFLFGCVVFIFLLLPYSMCFKFFNKPVRIQKMVRNIMALDEIEVIKQSSKSKKIDNNPLCVII
jgi:hypothetical protein